MDQLKDRWYQGRDGSDYHYHSSRYRACNMHSVFYHGTVEWRLFNSTLHAGEAKANIILAMAISAQGINQKYTQFRKTPIGDNPAFTFRTFLLRLGLIGPEYKNVRMHLLKNLPGDKAWRHDCAGRSVVAEPRPQPAQPRFSNAGRWAGYHVRQGNSRPHYRVRVIPRGRTVMSCG